MIRAEVTACPVSIILGFDNIGGNGVVAEYLRKETQYSVAEVLQALAALLFSAWLC